MSKYTHLGGTFWKSATKVFCEGRETKLDPECTRVFFESWAVDDERVFHYGCHRRAIDASTFVPLNCMYAVDKENCYFSRITVNKVNANADPRTLRVLDSGWSKLTYLPVECFPAGYATDGKTVFFNGNIVKAADAGSFVSLHNGYGYDNRAVFYGEKRLRRSDQSTWRQIGGKYSRDASCIYYQHKSLTKVNVSQFRHIRPYEKDWAFDGKSFFSGSERVDAKEYTDALERDPASVQDAIYCIENGEWQAYAWALGRPYRQPDETRFSETDAKVGDSRDSISARPGKCRVLEKAEWIKYFEDFHQTDGQEVVSWARGIHELVCIVEANQVAAILFVNRETPQTVD